MNFIEKIWRNFASGIAGVLFPSGIVSQIPMKALIISSFNQTHVLNRES